MIGYAFLNIVASPKRHSVDVGCPDHLAPLPSSRDQLPKSRPETPEVPRHPGRRVALSTWVGKARMISLLILSMTWAGVLIGASVPYQVLTS